MRGRKQTPATRAKIAKALRGNRNGVGHRLSRAARARLSEMMMGNQNGLGHTLSKRARAHLAAIMSIISKSYTRDEYGKFALR
jgi:hypothetical protein